MKKFFSFLIFILYFSTINAADWYSTYKGTTKNWTYTVLRGVKRNMEIDKISSYKITEWYVNGVSTGEVDRSGILAIDPDFSYTFSSVGTTTILGIVYNSSNSLEETHKWTVTVILPNTPPTVPGVPTFSSITKTSASISWAVSTDADGNPITYDLRYGKRYSIGWTEILNVSRPYILSGLVEKQEYTVQVRAKDNQEGVSGWTSDGYFTTLTNRIPTIPGVPTFSSITKTSASISWTVSTDADGNPITYDLRYGKRYSIGWTEILNVSRPYILSGLVENQEYTVQVRAKDNQGGISSWTADGYFTTLTNRVPTIPGVPTFSSITYNSASVTWTSSTDLDGDPVTYDLRYGKRYSIGWTEIINVTKPYTLTGLAENQEYTVQVRAKDNLGGISNWTADGYFTTAKINNPPVTPSGPSPSDGALNVSWSPSFSWSCSDPDGDIITYEFKYKKGLLGSWNTYSTYNKYYSLSGLDMNQDYYWKVFATDEHGLLTKSHTDLQNGWKFTTKVNNPPTVPGIPTFSSITYNSASVTWTSSTDPDGDPVTYDLRYGKRYSIGWTEITNVTKPYTLTGLAENQKYTVQVRAKDNLGGISNWTADGYFTTIKVNNTPNIMRKSPNNPYIAFTDTPNKFIVTCTEPDDVSDFNKVEWYVGTALKATHYYNLLTWANPHDDDFSFTFKTEGTYVVKAKVYDKSNESAELLWDINVFQDSKSDLSITDYSFGDRSTFILNSTIPWECNVQNIGQVKSKLAVLKLFWSQSPDNYDTNNLLKQIEIKDPSLYDTEGPDPGEISNCTGEFKLPSNLLPGYYYIHFVVDPEEKIVDSNRNNNHIAARIELVPSTLPDLVINSFTISNQEILPGTTITLNSKIGNNGGIIVGQTKVGYYLSLNDKFDSSDELIGYSNIEPILPGLSSAFSTYQFNISKYLTGGVWYIIAKADFENRIFEINESNNEQKIPILINGLPDLAFVSSALSVYEIAQRGFVILKTKIINQGNITADPSDVIIYLSMDEIIDVNDKILKTVELPILLSGSSTDLFEFTLNLPTDLVGSRYYIISEIKSKSGQAEIDISNNLKINQFDLIIEGGVQKLPLVANEVYSGSKAYFYTKLTSNLPTGTEFTFNLLNGDKSIPAGGKNLGNNLLQCWLDLKNVPNLQSVFIQLPPVIKTVEGISYNLTTNLSPFSLNINKIPVEQTISVFAGGTAGVSLSAGSIGLGAELAAAKLSVLGSGGMRMSFKKNELGEEFITRSFESSFGAELKCPSLTMITTDVEIGAKVGITAKGINGQTMKFDNSYSTDLIQKAKAAYILETFAYGGIEISPFVGTMIKALQVVLVEANNDLSSVYNQMHFSGFSGTGIETKASVLVGFQKPKFNLLDIGGQMAMLDKFEIQRDGNMSYELSYAKAFNMDMLNLEFFDLDLGSVYEYQHGTGYNIKANYERTKGFNSLAVSFDSSDKLEYLIFNRSKNYKYEFLIPESIIDQSISNNLINGINCVFLHNSLIFPMNVGVNAIKNDLQGLFEYGSKNVYSLSNQITYQKTANYSLGVSHDAKITLNAALGVGTGLVLGYSLSYVDDFNFPEAQYVFSEGRKLPLYENVPIPVNGRLFDLNDELEDLLVGVVSLIKEPLNKIIEATKKVVEAGKDFFIESYDKTCRIVGTLVNAGEMVLRSLDPAVTTVQKSATFLEPKVTIAYVSRRLSHSDLKNGNISEQDSGSVLYVVSNNYNINYINKLGNVVPTFNPAKMTISIDPKKMMALEFGDNVKSLARIYYYDAENLRWILAGDDIHAHPDTVSSFVEKSGSYAVGIEFNPLMDKTAPDIYDFGPKNGVNIPAKYRFWAKIYESPYGSGIDFSKTKMIIDKNEVDAIWDPVNNELFFELDYDLSIGPHQFTVIAYDKNGNKSEINNLITSNTTSISDFEWYHFKCYPNPFNNKLNIEFSLDSPQTVEVAVFNKNGQKIFQIADQQLQAGINNVVWNKINNEGRQVPSGMYFIRLIINKKIYVKKVIAN